MKNYRFFTMFLLVFSLLTITHPAFASSTNGTIDPVYHYAYGENIGWVDFANVLVTDTTLSGSAYSENTGWMDLSTVTNNNEGVLSGYAYGENIGWVDFSNVTIGNDGVFAGGAYSENTGWITFGTDTNKVMTDWRPASTRVVHHPSSGFLIGFKQAPIITPPSPIPIVDNNTPILPQRTLRIGMTGQDVKDLQIYLNTHNFIIATKGAGSPNNETMTFGKLTKQAVIKFQKVNSLIKDGVVGPLTRSKMK